jgi:hypothetical protein
MPGKRAVDDPAQFTDGTLRPRPQPSHHVPADADDLPSPDDADRGDSQSSAWRDMRSSGEHDHASPFAHARVGPAITMVGQIPHRPGAHRPEGHRTVALSVDVITTPDGRLSSRYQWRMTLDPVTSARIVGYRPRRARLEWPQVSDQVRTLVAALAPMNRCTLDRALKATAELAIWCYRQGLPSDPEVWLRNDTIEDFIRRSCGALAPSSARGYRTGLRHMRAALARAGRGPRGLHPMTAATRPAAPYDTMQLARLRHWAHKLTGQARKDALTLMGLAYGCGLTLGELATIRGEHVRILDTGMVVLDAAHLDRVIVARRAWQQHLAQVASSAGKERLYQPRRATAHLLGSWNAGRPSGALPALSARRLRTTWIVELLSAGVPEAWVASVAGLTLAELASYQHFVPRDPDEMDGTGRVNGGPPTS